MARAAHPGRPKVAMDPLWTAQVDWPGIVYDLGLGHPSDLPGDTGQTGENRIIHPCGINGPRAGARH